MSTSIDFLGNASKGYPLTTEILSLMQNDYKQLEAMVASHVIGDLVILVGMEWNGITINPGIFTYNGELVFFDGTGTQTPGDPGDIPDSLAIEIVDTVTTGPFCDASTNDLYTTKTARFSSTYPGDFDYGSLKTIDTIEDLSTRLNSTEFKANTNEAKIVNLNENPLGNEPLFTDNATVAISATSGGITDLTLTSATNALIWKEPNGRVTLIGQLNVVFADLDPVKADGLLFVIDNADAIFNVPSNVNRIYADQCYLRASDYVPLQAYINKSDGKVYFEQVSHSTVNTYVVGTIFFKFTYFANNNDL